MRNPEHRVFDESEEVSKDSWNFHSFLKIQKFPEVSLLFVCSHILFLWFCLFYLFLYYFCFCYIVCLVFPNLFLYLGYGFQKWTLISKNGWEFLKSTSKIIFRSSPQSCSEDVLKIYSKFTQHPAWNVISMKCIETSMKSNFKVDGLISMIGFCIFLELFTFTWKA